MSRMTQTLRVTLIAAIAIGLVVGTAGPVSAQDDGIEEDDVTVAVGQDGEETETTDGTLEFEQGDVELEVDSGGSLDFEDGSGTDLQIDSDGNIDLETPEGVTLETSDGSYELDGAGLDYEGEDDADIETVTDDGTPVAFEFSNGVVEEFEVGSTALEVSDGSLEYETGDVELEVENGTVALETATVDLEEEL